MGRDIEFQVLRGTQSQLQLAMPLGMGEMYFATDTGNLFFGTPGTGLGYIQIGDMMQVNETLQKIAVLLEAIRRATVAVACEGKRNKEQDFDPATISREESFNFIASS
jgi:hypothetical protein